MGEDNGFQNRLKNVILVLWQKIVKKQNYVKPRGVLKLLFNQTLRPYEIHLMDNLLTLLDRLIRQIPVYKMGCNISSEAVTMAYQAMLSGCTAQSQKH